jgi:hypothetical protein
LLVDQSISFSTFYFLHCFRIIFPNLILT